MLGSLIQWRPVIGENRWEKSKSPAKRMWNSVQITVENNNKDKISPSPIWEAGANYLKVSLFLRIKVALRVYIFSGDITFPHFGHYRHYLQNHVAVNHFPAFPGISRHFPTYSQHFPTAGSGEKCRGSLGGPQWIFRLNKLLFATLRGILYRRPIIWEFMLDPSFGNLKYNMFRPFFLELTEH